MWRRRMPPPCSRSWPILDSPLSQADPEQLLQPLQRAVRAAVQHRRHADGLRALAVLGQVVDEHALPRVEADALRAQLEDLRLRLVQADLARDHDAVEQLAEGIAVIA